MTDDQNEPRGLERIRAARARRKAGNAESTITEPEQTGLARIRAARQRKKTGNAQLNQPTGLLEFRRSIEQRREALKQRKAAEVAQLAEIEAQFAGKEGR